MKILNIGHIGWLANDQNDHAQTVAWCDADAARLQKRCASAPGNAGYTDYRELLGHPGVDLVVIATPNVFHCEMACRF